MEAITITVPENLKSFIDSQVAARDCESREEYVLELIREQQDSNEDERAEMRAFLARSHADFLAGRVRPAIEAIDSLEANS